MFAVLVFPVFWMISTAFKPDTEINALHTRRGFRRTRRSNTSVTPSARPYFWDVVKNSLIVVGAVVVLSMVVAFLAAVALAKYRFTGNKLFVVLVIGILMLPQAGLVIPLYVVLAKYHLTNHLLGLVFTHLVILLPFAVWTLRGFIMGIPKELEEAAMVDGLSRLGAFTRILLPLVAPGLVATSVFVFITSWNEYIFANVILTDQQNQTLTVWLSYFYGTSREHGLGRAHGGVDADGDPRRHLLPPRPAEDRFRPHRRRRQSVMSELERLASSCVLPGFEGPTVPDWMRRRLDEGLGGVVLYAWNVESREQLAQLTERPARGASRRRRRDRRGGRRRHETRGRAREAHTPGTGRSGVVDDVELTEAVAASIGAELAGVGVNLDFAPVADVNTNPQNPVIGIRSFGSDDELVARHVAAFVRGLAACRASPRARSTFPVTATPSLDSHLALPSVEDAGRAGARPVPCRDRRRSAVDHDRAHRRAARSVTTPATMSREMLHELLRVELGFAGARRDRCARDEGDQRRRGSRGGRRSERSLAGADALCLGHDLFDESVRAVRDALVEAVRSGRLPEERLVDAAARVGRLASWASERDEPATVDRDAAGSPRDVHCSSRATFGSSARRSSSSSSRRSAWPPVVCRSFLASGSRRWCRIPRSARVDARAASTPGST